MNKNYCVYEHIFPNGKKYIGISCDAEKRWRNGKGYETQPKIARAINKYVWENVTHNIIIDGISKEQAETLERYLIAELKTIEHGYNTSTGGDCIVAYYLNDYTLAMLNYAEKNFEPNFIYPVSFNDGEEIGMPEIIAEGKTDKEIAEFFNEATRAVTMKHRKYSATSEDDVFAYFFHMREYYLLSLAIENGIDVSQWEESTCYCERYKLKGGEDRTMRLNMGTTRKETEKTLCVYRYTDIEDEQIKYVGIVRKGKLSNRLQSHETDDEWCKNRGWFIEYFDCDTQSEAEAFEAHLIALYGTDKFYNVKKAGWGINKYLPDVEKWWKPAIYPVCSDFETMRLFWQFKKAVSERNHEEAERLLKAFEIIREE